MIDACVHPFPRGPQELHKYLPNSWRHLRIGSFERFNYPCPHGEYIAQDPGATKHAGSDPELMRQLLNEQGTEIAILVPLSNGLQGDTDLCNAVCSTINDWLADVWLDKANGDGLFRGSIRINPEDPEYSVREIERWHHHPFVAQVVVPLQAHQPYGKRAYLPIWQAAASSGLPVAVHIDGGPGHVDYWPTPAGYCRFFAEWASLYPLNYVYHLASLIMEGVFERLPNVTFVFEDGGYGVLAPFMWHLDKDWRSALSDTPWIRQPPSSYLRRHVRFCSNRREELKQGSVFERWLSILGVTEMVMWGSNWPLWDHYPAGEAYVDVSEATRSRLMHGNAAAVYCTPRAG